MDTKLCIKCKVIKPITEFRKGKNQCKECIKEHIKEYNKKNKEHIKEYKKEYNKKNKEYLNEKCKEYNKKNKEHIKEYNKKNKEHIKEYKKEYYQKNKEHIKEYYKEYNKEYCKTDRGKQVIKNRSHKRRALKRKASVHTISAKFMRKLDNILFCCHCGCKLTERHIDHIIPLSRGGRHSEGNLQVLCPRCNLSKHNKLEIEVKQCKGI